MIWEFGNNVDKTRLIFEPILRINSNRRPINMAYYENFKPL